MVIGLLALAIDYLVEIGYVNLYIIFSFCFKFLLYYVFGMYCTRNEVRVRHFGLSIVVITVTLILSVVEGIVWFSYGNASMAMTQGKLSSYLYAGAIIFSVLSCGVDYMLHGEEGDNRKCATRRFDVFDKLLKCFGDYSYGIYYIHCLVLMVVRVVLSRIAFPLPVYIAVVLLMTAFISPAFVMVGAKVLGKEAGKILGLN